MSHSNPSERVNRTSFASPVEGPSFSSPHELVTICVGPNKKPFIIHKEAASSSPVLWAAFDSGFIEGQTQTYNLADGDPQSFPLVVQWMYRQSVIFPATQEELSSLPKKGSGNRMTSSTVQIITKICRHLVCLVQVWIIADYLQIPRLQNYVVDTIEQIRVDSAVLTFHCLAEVYHKLPREAAVRELVFEQSIRFLTPEIYEANDCEKWLPRQFLLDHIIADKRSKGKQAQLDPFIDRAEFKRRFHVPEGI